MILDGKIMYNNLDKFDITKEDLDKSLKENLRCKDVRTATLMKMTNLFFIRGNYEDGSYFVDYIAIDDRYGHGFIMAR